MRRRLPGRWRLRQSCRLITIRGAMEKGWSVRVTFADVEEIRPSVRWYIVAEAEPEAAVAALRRAFDVGDARVEAVQRIPSLFQGRRMHPGEVAYLYSRGTPRPDLAIAKPRKL